nr:hypothetical protein [Granulicella aggregans]
MTLIGEACLDAGFAQLPSRSDKTACKSNTPLQDVGVGVYPGHTRKSPKKMKAADSRDVRHCLQ